MRLRTLIMPMALGLAARAVVRHRRDQRARRDHTDRADGADRADDRARSADSFASDPGDPVQSFDEVVELQVMPLEVDALSIEDAEAAQDLAGLESEIDQVAGDDAELVDVDVDASRDAGDLYGARVPAATEPVKSTHPDEREAAEGQSWDGQNWIEALETSVIEDAAAPERALAFDDPGDDDDRFRPQHPADRRDTPVADHGSGGRRGV
jgi:hypothetical protein